MREQLWALDVLVSAEGFLTSATERRTLDWTGTPALVLGRLGLLPAALATCRCAMGDGPRPLRTYDLDRRADLSVVPRWGCDVLIFRGRA